MSRSAWRNVRSGSTVAAELAASWTAGSAKSAFIEAPGKTGALDFDGSTFGSDAIGEAAEARGTAAVEVVTAAITPATRPSTHKPATQAGAVRRDGRGSRDRRVSSIRTTRTHSTMPHKSGIRLGEQVNVR
jgi:hypothetical protein